MSSTESHLDLLDSIVRSAERLCECELCCLGRRRKTSTLCLLCKIYHRVNHPMNEYLKQFVAARNTSASVALGGLIMVIPGFRTDQFSRYFLPVAGRLWNLLPSGVFSRGTLNSFRSGMNLCLLRA